MRIWDDEDLDRLEKILSLGALVVGIVLVYLVVRVLT